VKSSAEEEQVLRDLQNLHIAPECAQDIAQELRGGKEEEREGGRDGRRGGGWRWVGGEN
jgi:hypothetical protein